MQIDVVETYTDYHTIVLTDLEDIPEEECERLAPKIDEVLDKYSSKPYLYNIDSVAEELSKITNSDYLIWEDSSNDFNCEFEYDFE